MKDHIFELQRKVWRHDWSSQLKRCSGGPKGRQAEPHTHIGKKRKPMTWFSHGYHGQRYCSWARTHDDGDGVAQHGGHTSNRLRERYSLGLPCTSLILNIHAKINWQLSKQGIRWPESRDHIVGSTLQLVEVTCFCEVDRWPSAGFLIESRDHVRLTCWKQGRIVQKPD